MWVFHVFLAETARLECFDALSLFWQVKLVCVIESEVLTRTPQVVHACDAQLVDQRKRRTDTLHLRLSSSLHCSDNHR